MIKPVEMLTLDFMEDGLVLIWHIKGTMLLLNRGHRGAPKGQQRRCFTHRKAGANKQR